MKHQIKDLLHKLLLSRLGDSSASFWMTPLGGLEPREIPMFPAEEYGDPQATIDTEPIQPIDTLECLNCGRQIELKYFGHHTEWCGLDRDVLYHKPNDQELDY